VDVYPAIDIRSGRVVRLAQGEPGRETEYNSDPVALAEQFVWQGARWLHIVDLDRAFGDGDNSHLIRRIITRVGSHVQIQLSGGFRSLAALRAVLPLEVTRLVVGTVAITQPDLVNSMIEEAGPHRIAVGLDARNGYVAIRGWAQATDQRVDDVARRVIAAGVRTLIYTDVARDGMLSGPDVAGALALQALGAGVIASGGVSSLADLATVMRAGLAGAVVGRALYEGRFTVAEALMEVGQRISGPSIARDK
jgi:phosphoribosylformimino-5-aminoimidazole carboxamide ribotide isomerase